MTDVLPEAWLRGAVPGIAPMLQPVAHSLLQCQEEIHRTLSVLTPEQIAARPGGAASVGFHVRHTIGALDRLLTYARGEQLSDVQQKSLESEAAEDLGADVGARLTAAFDAAVSRAMDQVSRTSESTLLEARVVGRGRLPSNVIGLLFHAAEYTQRHAGQCVTTSLVVRGTH